MKARNLFVSPNHNTHRGSNALNINIEVGRALTVDLKMQFGPIQLQRDLCIQQAQFRSAICESRSIFDELLDIGASEREVDIRSPAIRGEINRLDIVDLKFEISEF